MTMLTSPFVFTGAAAWLGRGSSHMPAQAEAGRTCGGEWSNPWPHLVGMRADQHHRVVPVSALSAMVASQRIIPRMYRSPSPALRDGACGARRVRPCGVSFHRIANSNRTVMCRLSAKDGADYTVPSAEHKSCSPNANSAS